MQRSLIYMVNVALKYDWKGLVKVVSLNIYKKLIDKDKDDWYTSTTCNLYAVSEETIHR